MGGGGVVSRIYLASSWRNEIQPMLVEELRDWGHEVYDFRNPQLGPGKRGVGFHWETIDPNWMNWTAEQYRDALKHQEAKEGFASDLEGMEWADTCVLLLPSGRSAHAEAGWMAGQQKRVIVATFGPTQPELMYLLFDRIVVTRAELKEALDAD